MNPSVQFYRLGDPGLILVWRGAAGTEPLRLASDASFAPDTLVAELPARRRFALIPAGGGALRTLYWRTVDGPGGRVVFTGRPLAETTGETDWETCSMTRRALPGSASADTAPAEGLRAACRPDANGERGTWEWTDAEPLATPRDTPRLQAFFAYESLTPSGVRRRGAENHGDLRVRIVPNAGLLEPVRVWIDRLHPQDLTPEPMTDYDWDGHGWIPNPGAESTVFPGRELHLKIPRLVESPTSFRPSRLAVDERDVMVVRVWPEVEVQTLIVPPREEDSEAERPEPFPVPAVEYVDGDLVAPDPARTLVKSLQKHWEQRRAELAATGARDEWGALPTGSRLFLAGYRRWLPDWTPARLAAVLLDERFFAVLTAFPPGIGSRLLEEFSVSVRHVTQASGSDDADRRLAAFFDNPGLSHAVADDPGFASTLAKTTGSEPPRPFTSVRWLAARLPAEPRVVDALARTTGETALSFLAALAERVSADDVVETLCAGFRPGGGGEVATAAVLLGRLRRATDLSILGTGLDSLAEAPQAQTLEALRQRLEQGGYPLAELQNWVCEAEAAREQLSVWCLAAERARARGRLVDDIAAALRMILPLSGTADAAALRKALDSALADVPPTPETTAEWSEGIGQSERRLTALRTEWEKRERDTRRADGAGDDGLNGFLELFGARVAVLAHRGVAEGAKEDLRGDLTRLDAHESIFGPEARGALAPLVAEARARLSDAPPSFYELPALQARLRATLDAVLPQAAEVHAAATRLLSAATALADAVPGDWQLPPFENAEQFAADLETRLPVLRAGLEQGGLKAREEWHALVALAEMVRADVPNYQDTALLAWPGPGAGTAAWAGALADRAEALLALTAATHGAGPLVRAQAEAGACGPDPGPVVGALHAGRYVEALEIVRSESLRARLAQTREEVGRLLSPSGDARAYLDWTPPLVPEGEDSGWFRHSGGLLTDLEPDADAATMETRLAALETLRQEILRHDVENGRPCRSVLLGAWRARCRQAHERLNRDGGVDTPEGRVLAQIPFEQWGVAELRAAEKHG